ncbi:hypothetical protein ABZY58_11630 [Micromonospora tulbaghiae]|uniref:hypothetical protein n=1 Tax=Micromonospora tulbaghiae TaxID=479978 RepID=UPI0033B3E3C3
MTDELILWLERQLDASEQLAQAYLTRREREGTDRETWAYKLALASVTADRALVAAYMDAETYYQANRNAPAGELHGLLTALKHRVAVHADEPGYQERWRP